MVVVYLLGIIFCFWNPMFQHGTYMALKLTNIFLGGS